MKLILPSGVFPAADRRLTTVPGSLHSVRADLIIVGAGLAGAAAARSAAARGASVVVLEQFAPGNRNGSSHGSARIFRRAYPDPLYVRLTGQAGEQWLALEAAAGETLLTMTGELDFGALRDPAGLHAVLTGCGVPADLLPPREASRRWPQFDFTGTGLVLFHQNAGVLDPDRTIAALLRLATAHGADVRFGTRVTGLAAGGDGAVVRAVTAGGQESFTAPTVVVAAGAWLTPLLDGLVRLPPLTVTKQAVFHFGPAQAPGSRAEPAGQAGPAEQPWPVFIFQHEADSCYGLPGGRDGGAPGAIKVGEHHPGTVTTAAGRDFAVDAAARARVAGFAGRRLPGLDPAPLNETTCLYTWTANEDFILDRQGPFVVASPCSGHGAKFAPLLGELIADLAAGKPPPDARFTLAAHLAG
jgi:monomeric sarcosine oxidase